MGDRRSGGRRAIEEVRQLRARVAKLERIRRDPAKAKSADNELDMAWSEWETTFDMIGDSIMVLGGEFNIVQANAATSRFFGKPLDEIIHKRCCELMHGSSEAPKDCPLEKAKKTNGRETTQMHVPEKDIWVNVTVDPIFGEEGELTGAVHIIKDITERKQAEEEIERLAKFPSEDPNPVLRISKEGDVLYSNEAGNVLLAEWKSEVGKKVPKRWRDLIGQSFESQEDTAAAEEEEEEVNGKVFSVTIAPVKDAGYANLYARDVTESKKAEEKLLDKRMQLKAMALELTLAEERERRRIAVGIHDDIGQKLALAKFELQAFMASPGDSRIPASLDSVCAKIDTAIEGAHSLTFELSNPALYELSFEAAIEQWFIEQIQKKHGIKCLFGFDEQPIALDVNTRIVLFKAVRELAVNTVKHAKANAMRVEIKRIGKNVRIKVVDNGIGFAPLQADAPLSNDKRGGFGLLNVRERLEHLGGDIKIKSASGKGTRITLTAPLEQQNNTTGGVRK